MDSHKVKRRRVVIASRAIPLLVGLSGIVGSIVLWRALDLQQDRRIQRMVQFEVAFAAHQLESGLAGRSGALAQIAQLWDRTPPAQARQEIDHFVKGQIGCLGVARVSPQKAVEWIDSAGQTKLPQALADLGGEAVLDNAINVGLPVVVRAPRSRWNNSWVLLYYAPHNPGTPGGGGLIAAMRLQQFADTILNSNVAAGYALAIRDRDEALFDRMASQSRFREKWEQALTVRAPGLNWKLHLWPTQEVIDRESLSLPKLALGVGLLTTVLLALAVYLAQTAQRRAAELTRSEAKHRCLTENLEQGVFLKDPAGHYIAVNNSYCRGFGRTEAEVIGKTDAELFPGSVAQLFAEQDQAVRAGGGRVEVERVLDVNGNQRTIHRILTLVRDSNGTVGILGICWDVTEQRALESRLRQSSKLDAIGQLAGGIAHDFNNLLTAILGNLDLMLADMAPGDQHHDLASSAQGAAVRAASLTTRLLGFSRQHQLDWHPTDLNDITDEVVELLSPTIDPRIRITTHKDSELWLVQADPTQMNQVLMNLCINARDAIAGSGQITIETANVDKVDQEIGLGARSGKYVRLRVRDTGCGMTPEVKTRIFEPFFTTKAVGKGTGLGLAMVFAIVKQHQGWVECHSEVNAGTRFDVYFPRTNAAAKPVPRPAEELELARRSGATVLVVDDEPTVRKLAALSLERAGFAVIEAEDGAEAVEVYARERNGIDIVLLDLMMPNISGQETFVLLRRINPNVKVLFASGYTSDEFAGPEREHVLGFIKKPFRPNELAQVILEALEQSATAPGQQAELTACRQ